MNHNRGDLSKDTFIDQIILLRRYVIHCILAIALLFLGLLYFADQIYALIAAPLVRFLPGTMIATDVTTPFTTPVKLTFVVSCFLSIPYLFFRMWCFLAPALYRHERRMLLGLTCISCILFLSGIVFAYFVVFPILFSFFVTHAPENVTVMTDIHRYIDFVLTLFFAFGMAFEIPIILFVLLYKNILSYETLSQKRPYVILACFVIGMLMTPPDVFSQTLLAIPMWLLFELGLFIARYTIKKHRTDHPSTHY